MSVVAETATLAHGYTMAHVDNMARYVARKYPTIYVDSDDAIAAAWFGIVEALYTATEPPTRFELNVAGKRALDVERNRTISQRGYTMEGGVAPKFVRYWLPVRTGWSDGFSEQVVERMALPNVLGVLTDLQYEAIATLAAFNNDNKAAAAALGIKDAAFSQRVQEGRKRAKAAWFDEETPVRSRSSSETCRYGHSRAEHSTKSPRGWQCRICKRNSQRRRRSVVR